MDDMNNGYPGMGQIPPQVPQMPQMPPMMPPPQQGGKGLAIASMVLGIVSLVLCFCVWISVPCAIIGLILGIVSLAKHAPGKGMALAGVITSGIGVVLIILSLLGFLTGLTGLSTYPGMSNFETYFSF